MHKFLIVQVWICWFAVLVRSDSKVKSDFRIERIEEREPEIVNCKPGRYIHKRWKTCKKCPKGTFQPYSNQNQCYKCPVGYHARKTGRARCKPCSPGFYKK